MIVIIINLSKTYIYIIYKKFIFMRYKGFIDRQFYPIDIVIFISIFGASFQCSVVYFNLWYLYLAVISYYQMFVLAPITKFLLRQFVLVNKYENYFITEYENHNIIVIELLMREDLFFKN